MLWMKLVLDAVVETTHQHVHLESHDIKSSFEALNDDLSLKFDDRINSTDKKLLDCPNNAPDAGRHISVNWTI